MLVVIDCVRMSASDKIIKTFLIVLIGVCVEYFVYEYMFRNGVEGLMSMARAK